MRKATTALLIALGLSLLLGLAATAQKPGPTPPGWNYDSTTVETVQGTVVQVVFTQSGRGEPGGGVHLVVDTGKEPLEVYLGPRFYLEENDFEIEPGDEVEITGSRVTLGGNKVLIAREFRSGDYALELRGEDGTPNWAGEGGPRMGGAGMGMGPGPGERPSKWYGRHYHRHCGACCCCAGGRER